MQLPAFNNLSGLNEASVKDYFEYMKGVFNKLESYYGNRGSSYAVQMLLEEIGKKIDRLQDLAIQRPESFKNEPESTVM